MNKRTRLLAEKYTLYGLMILGLFLVQTDPYLLYLGDCKPVLVLPMAVAIAMLDGELVGGLFGLAAGLLCDASGTVIFGFNSMLYMSACVAVGLVVIYYMQPSWKNSVLFTGVIFSLRLLMEYFFYYVMWDYEGISRVLLGRMLPALLYTLAVTPAVFWVVQKVRERFAKKLES